MRIRDGFVLRRLPDMALIMPTGRQTARFSGALKLNETGAFIFERLQRGHTPEETAQALAAAYEVSAEQAEADVQAMIAVFIGNGVAEA